MNKRLPLTPMAKLLIGTKSDVNVHKLSLGSVSVPNDSQQYFMMLPKVNRMEIDNQDSIMIHVTSTYDNAVNVYDKLREAGKVTPGLETFMETFNVANKQNLDYIWLEW